MKVSISNYGVGLGSTPAKDKDFFFWGIKISHYRNENQLERIFNHL